MRKTYRKNIRRTIGGTLSRFGAIFAIVALGVGFLAGLMATTPDMRYSGDRYFDDTNLFDLRIVSTLGLEEADVQAVRAVEGVQDVMPGYAADMLLADGSGDVYVTRIHSLPQAAEKKNAPGYLNRLEVLEGRLPTAPNECVIEQGVTFDTAALGVGDTLTLAPGNKNPQDTLAGDTFRVVGVVQSSYYFSVEKESASVGNGTIGLIAYLPEPAFSADVYTNLFVTLSGAQEQNAFEDAYQALTDDVTARIEDISAQRCEARLQNVRQEAQQKVDDARDELDSGWDEYSEAEQKANRELAKAWKKITDGQRQVTEGEQSLASAQAQLDAGQAQLDAAKVSVPAELDKKEAELAAAQAQLDAQKPGLAQLQQGLQQAEDAVAALQAAVDAGDTTPETAAALQQAQATAAALRTQYETAAAQLAAAQAQLDAGRQAIADGRVQAQQQFAATQAQLAEGRRQLAEGLTTLEQSRKDIAQGKKTYAQEKEKAQKELADAKLKLEDGEEELAEAEADIRALELPEWYVLNRETNVSYASFNSNIQKVEAIARIFPIFFFLVAALVALTTMTRMVEEERLQIGTMKALGYTKGAIMAKYILYALLASVLGSAVGLAVGFQLFPTVIWNAYTMMYTLPKLYCQFNVKYAVISSSVAIACTLAATLNACWSTLAEPPAHLLLPRAPKAGKRILLERVGFVWKRMKFTHKVTARNLFRYKKRFFMTVIGIAGCTALLVTGFGLHDSISDIVNKQFDEIFTYDVVVALRDKKALRSEELNGVLSQERVESTLRVHQEKSDNTYGGTTFSSYLFVPEDTARVQDFIHLRQRISGQGVPFSQTGVVITEKMSERTGYTLGDTIELKNSDGRKGTFRIDGIAENYVENYVYLSAETYEAQFGKAPQPTAILVRMADESRAARDALAEDLLQIEGVTGLNFIEDLRQSFSDMMRKIDTIVVVLIVSAALLAFVVLYNLTNINITERTKEIATIKVLGFTQKEVQAYIYRESVVLTLIGTLCGLVLGIFLHQFVIYNVEVDMVMFGRTIAPLSYAYSAALTLVFSAFVNLVMRRKLRNISMVESMKAPE